jgi:hypothetical protein
VGADSDLSRVQQQLLVSLEAVHVAAIEANQIIRSNPEVDGAPLAMAIRQLLDTQSELFDVVQEFLRSAEPSVAPPDERSTTSIEERSAIAEAPAALLNDPAVAADEPSPAEPDKARAESALSAGSAELPTAPVEPSSEPNDVSSVTLAGFTKRSKREYDYFADLRRELADGEPSSPPKWDATTNGDAAGQGALEARTDQNVTCEDARASTKTNGRGPEHAEGPDAAIKEFPEDWGDPQEWVEAPLRRLFRGRARRASRATQPPS